MNYRMISQSLILVSVFFLITSLQLRAQESFSDLGPAGAAPALGAESAGESFTVTNEETGVEITVNGVSTDSGIICSDGIPALEGFEDTNLGPNSLESCPTPLNTLTNDLCYSQGEVIPGFTLSTFNDLNPDYVVVTPSTFSVTNVAVGPNTFDADSRIVLDLPTNRIEFQIFDGLNAGGTVDIAVYNQFDVLLVNTPVVLGSTAAPTITTVFSIDRNIKRIDITEITPGTGELIYHLDFCNPFPVANGGLGALLANRDNWVQLAGATPNGRVALIMGKEPGSFIVGGPVCNGLELGLTHPYILGILKANGSGIVNGKVFIPFFELPQLLLEAVDINSCTVIVPPGYVPLLND